MIMASQKVRFFISHCVLNFRDWSRPTEVWAIDLVSQQEQMNRARESMLSRVEAAASVQQTLHQHVDGDPFGKLASSP